MPGCIKRRSVHIDIVLISSRVAHKSNHCIIMGEEREIAMTPQSVSVSEGD